MSHQPYWKLCFFSTLFPLKIWFQQQFVYIKLEFLRYDCSPQRTMKLWLQSGFLATFLGQLANELGKFVHVNVKVNIFVLLNFHLSKPFLYFLELRSIEVNAYFLKMKQKIHTNNAHCMYADWLGVQFLQMVVYLLWLAFVFQTQTTSPYCFKTKPNGLRLITAIPFSPTNNLTFNLQSIETTKKQQIPEICFPAIPKFNVNISDQNNETLNCLF